MLKSNCSDTDFSVISCHNPKHQGCPRPPSEMKTIQSVQQIEISIAQNPMRDRTKIYKDDQTCTATIMQNCNSGASLVT